MDQQERDTLLVPTDFTDVSDFAVDHAIEIAKIFGRKICLLHVVHKKNIETSRLMLLEKNMETHAAAIIRRTGLSVSYLVVEGSIFTTISEVAERIRAEFIVMGIHGKRGVQLLVGSYAYKVVKSSRIPVLLVKHMHHHVGYKNIVLPVNFSGKRAHKIAEAIKFARYFSATVRIFGYQSSLNKAKILNKEALLNNVREIFKKENIQVSTDLLVNPGYDWAEALMKYASDIDADLVMMVADKPGFMTDMFSANATERIIDRADVPILAVAPSEIYREEQLQKRAFLKPFIDPLGLLSETETQS